MVINTSSQKGHVAKRSEQASSSSEIVNSILALDLGSLLRVSALPKSRGLLKENSPKKNVQSDVQHYLLPKATLM